MNLPVCRDVLFEFHLKFWNTNSLCIQIKHLYNLLCLVAGWMCYAYAYAYAYAFSRTNQHPLMWPKAPGNFPR